MVKWRVVQNVLRDIELDIHFFDMHTDWNWDIKSHEKFEIFMDMVFYVGCGCNYGICGNIQYFW